MSRQKVSFRIGNDQRVFGRFVKWQGILAVVTVNGHWQLVPKKDLVFEMD